MNLREFQWVKFVKDDNHNCINKTLVYVKLEAEEVQITGEAFGYDSTKEYNKPKHIITGNMDWVCRIYGEEKFRTTRNSLHE